MKITLVGLGLIGGTTAFTIRGFRNSTILGVDISQETCQKAKEANVVDDASTHLSADHVDSDLFIFSLYPRDTVNIIRDNVQFFKPGSIITEFCGIKTGIVEQVREALPDYVDYIPCHPMAGGERQGFDFADPSIFRNRNFLILPLSSSLQSSIDLFHEMAIYMGFGKIQTVNIEQHDASIAYTSHLTHLVASALCLPDRTGISDIFVGRGYLDTTRIARVNAPLWCELYLSNKDSLLYQIAEFEEALRVLKMCIVDGDGQKLETLLEKGSSNRQALVEGLPAEHR